MQSVKLTRIKQPILKSRHDDKLLKSDTKPRVYIDLKSAIEQSDCKPSLRSSAEFIHLNVWTLLKLEA